MSVPYLTDYLKINASITTVLVYFNGVVTIMRLVHCSHIQWRIHNLVQRLSWSFFAKIFNDRKQSMIFAKGPILDVRQGFKYASDSDDNVLALSRVS